MNKDVLLNTEQMAKFVANGFLEFDGLVDQKTNKEFIDIFFNNKSIDEIKINELLPILKPGTKLVNSYSDDNVIGKLIKNPYIKGAIESLVGRNPIVDHHHIHISMPNSQSSQYNHFDSAIDKRTQTFDIQLLYFPHEVKASMGGTRYIPGTHFRIVHTHHIARYQNILGQKFVCCKPGTVLIFHHGLWHGGGRNLSETPRIMFKLRLQPTEPQILLWNTEDITEERIKSWQRPIYHGDKSSNNDPVPNILMNSELWFDSNATLEWINRIKLWRILLGKPKIDIDNWMSRLENDPGSII